MFHPFSSAKSKAPKYQDSHLRGLLLEVQVPTEPIRLSEVRQLRVQAILRNIGSSPVPLDFPTSQRIDIHLLNSAGEVLTAMVGEPRFHRGNRQSHDQSTRTSCLQRNDRHPRIAARSGLQCRSFLPQISGTACPAEVHDRAVRRGVEQWSSGVMNSEQHSITPTLQHSSSCLRLPQSSTGPPGPALHSGAFAAVDRFGAGQRDPRYRFY